MEPDDTEAPPGTAPTVTILERHGKGERRIGYGLLVGEDVVLADEALSARLSGRETLFPPRSDDLRVLFDPTDPTARHPRSPGYHAQLGEGESVERIEVYALTRAVKAPWVGLRLAEPSRLAPGELPAAATDGLPGDGEEGNSVLCRLMPKFC